MSYTYSVNNTPATGAVAMYTLISTLLSAGWTQQDSSDGTTRAAGQVTTGASGTHGLGNSSAWVRLSAPAVNGGNVVNQVREITIQRGTTDLVWRIKYSASAGFVGGSPAATVTPSATDEVFMAGGGTDASPTFLSWFAANGTYRWHVAAGGAAEFYSFLAWGLISATTNMSIALALDVMATGSFPTTDVDPAVFYLSGANATSAISEVIAATFVSANATNPAKARAWLGATSAAGAATSGTNSQNVSMVTFGTNIVGGAVTLGTNPFTSKDDLLPVPWGRSAAGVAPVGWKGYSTLFMYGTVNRTNMDTADTVSTGSKDKAWVNGLWAPWSGATPTI